MFLENIYKVDFWVQMSIMMGYCATVLDVIQTLVVTWRSRGTNKYTTVPHE